jgi:WD40 repeat protein
MLTLWDLDTGHKIRDFKGHSQGVHSVAISPDGKTVLSGSDDGTLRHWDLESGIELRQYRGHSDQVKSVVFSRDGRKAVSGGSNRRTRAMAISNAARRSGFTVDCGRRLNDTLHNRKAWRCPWQRGRREPFRCN